jgi:hypothetical protein
LLVYIVDKMPLLKSMAWKTMHMNHWIGAKALTPSNQPRPTRGISSYLKRFKPNQPTENWY